VTYEAYQEFLLDRIAANYVSFTILDDDDIDTFQAGYTDSGSTSSKLSMGMLPRRKPHVDI